MDLRDFSEIGQQIERTVKNAVDSMNFDQLSQNINKTFDDAFGKKDTATGNPYDSKDDQSRSQTRQGKPFYYQPKNPYQSANFQRGNTGRTARTESSTFGSRQQSSAAGRRYTWQQENTRQNQSYNRGPSQQPYAQNNRAYDTRQTTAVGFPIMQKPPGRVSSVLMMVFGYTGLGLTGLSLLFSLAASAFVGKLFSVGAAVTIVTIPILVICTILAVSGTKTRGRLSRFRRYIDVLKGRTFCSLKELAANVGKNKRFVFKDVQKMIRDGFFPEGHLDEQKTCLMVTDKIYEQYLAAQESMKTREAAKSNEDDEAVEEDSSKNTQSLTQEELKAYNKIINDGEMYMQHIREANDAIPDMEISNKLYRMELIIRKIFDYVRSHPEQISQLRRFIDYYMPTTDKLVNAYREFEEQPIQGDNIKTAKLEISKALDTINDAYEKLYDSMYADAAMDVASDISVLQTLLAQEGLTKDDFKHGRKKS